ncbi:glycosyltransferase family 4 protein [Foetidibacter luteolus]|uniref:glycosyltransferase family 4 protein n=1 Tax=Foetidibacter luteolus TaxID=2608880 RepID=UPI00129BC80D|nr:glycosyltransferase family 4 protein [Foetidibacter luteolus]
MRIGIVVQSFPSISETFIFNRVLYLSKRGHQVIVFARQVNMDMQRQLFAGNSNVAVVACGNAALVKHIVTHPWLIAAGNNGSRQGFKKKIITAARLALFARYRPDIMHFEFSGIAVDHLAEIEKITAKKVVSCRGTGEKVKLLTDKGRKEKLQQVFNQVNLVHCVSNDIRNAISPYCSNMDKVFINYPSIDTERFKRSSEYADAGVITILTIGRLTFQKGYLTGLLAVRKLKQSGVKLRWLIVGAGPQEEEIVFHINQMQLNNEVEMLGAKKREEVIDLYNKVNIFLLPSVYEGVANVVLEAMSMELPVVSTKSGGMDEVITHDADGLLTEVYDSDLLATHMERLAKDYGLRKKLGVAARVTVQNRFNINLQADIFEAHYKKLMDTTAAVTQPV